MTSPSEPFDAPSPADAPSDRDAIPQYVLPLVLHLEKADPPRRTDALETSARAVLTFLADPRVTSEDGEWAERAHAWEDARIRKVVRRARGGEWRKAAELPGITVTGKQAEVRVYPPVPLDGWPKELVKLQVSGLELTDEPQGVPHPNPQVSGTELDDPEQPTAPDALLPVLWFNPEVPMSTGKSMAQAGHGAQLAWWALSDADRAAWRDSGFALAVRTATPERWSALTASGLPMVRDAGFTEIAPGSCTVVADHPALRRS